MKNIYDKINDDNFNFDAYEKKQLNDIEKNKYKKTFKKNIRKKRRNLGTIAAIAVIIIGFMSTEAGHFVYAKTEDILSDFNYSLKTALNINDNIDKYTSVINKEITDKGITMKLNEIAVADENHIYLSAGIKLPENFELLTFDKKIYINGKKYQDMSTTGFTEYNPSSGITNIYYEIGLNKNIDLNSDLNIRIKIDNILIKNSKDESNKDINGLWTFDFVSSGKDLTLDTKNYTLDNIIKTGNETIKFNSMKINKINQSLYADIIKKGNPDKVYEIDIVDNLGNKSVFELREADKNHLFFKTGMYKFDKNAEKLTLNVKYKNIPQHSGSMDMSNMNYAGSFTINLK